MQFNLQLQSCPVSAAVCHCCFVLKAATKVLNAPLCSPKLCGLLCLLDLLSSGLQSEESPIAQLLRVAAAARCLDTGAAAPNRSASAGATAASATSASAATGSAAAAAWLPSAFRVYLLSGQARAPDEVIRVTNHSERIPSLCISHHTHHALFGSNIIDVSSIFNRQTQETCSNHRPSSPYILVLIISPIWLALFFNAFIFCSYHSPISNMLSLITLYSHAQLLTPILIRPASASAARRRSSSRRHSSISSPPFCAPSSERSAHCTFPRCFPRSDTLRPKRVWCVHVCVRYQRRQ